MGKCLLCEKNTNEYWFSNWCKNCRRVKHYLSLYHDRVYEVLDSVLSRTSDKQDNKIKVEIKTEIENKEHHLRSKKSVVTSDKQSKNSTDKK